MEKLLFQLNKIQKEKKEKKENIEFEARITIDFTFDEIVEKLNSLQFYSSSQQNDIVYHYDEPNYRVINLNGKKLYQIKNNIFSTKLDFQGYICKFNIAEEKEIIDNNEKLLLDNKNPTLKRTRTRTIFKNQNTNYEFHITRTVEENLKINDIKYKTTVEIEYNSDIYNQNIIITPLQSLFDIFYVKTIHLLPSNEIRPIIEKFNRNIMELKYSNPNFNNPKFINLLKEGGIEKYEDKPVTLSTEYLDEVKTENYFVTNKLNGQRYFLYIIQGNIYLIYNNGSKNSKIKSHVWLFGKTEIKDTIIIDGEYFESKFYAFDMLSFNNQNYRYEPFNKRLGILQNCIHYINNNNIIMKYFQFGNKVNEIISLMENTFKSNWDENNDGLIFTNINSKYFDKNSKIFKWKFPHHQSIDVKIKFKYLEQNEYTFDILTKNRENINVLFTNLVLKSSTPLDENIIYEVAFDYKIKNFYMLRSRPDKL